MTQSYNYKPLMTQTPKHLHFDPCGLVWEQKNMFRNYLRLIIFFFIYNNHLRENLLNIFFKEVNGIYIFLYNFIYLFTNI